MHTHKHSQTCFLSYITCVSVETVLSFLPGSCLFLSPSYILLLSSNCQRRYFPSLTQTFDPDAVFFRFPEILFTLETASTPPIHWPSSTHLPHHQLANTPVSASFMVKQGGRGSDVCVGVRPNQTACQQPVIKQLSLFVVSSDFVSAPLWICNACSEDANVSCRQPTIGSEPSQPADDIPAIEQPYVLEL